MREGQKIARSTELDWLRVAAMVGVVTIHVTSTFIYLPSGAALLGMNLAFWLNQIVRFAVPAFILASGYALGLKDGEDAAWPKTGRRLIKLLLPYAVWTCIYWCKDHRLDLAGLPRALLTGTAAAHLYFVVVLAQLYLLYPLLRRQMDRRPVSALLVTGLVTGASQWALYEGAVPGPEPLRQLFWELFPAWIFFFALGAFLARQGGEALLKWAGDRAGFLAALSVLFALWLAREGRVSGIVDSFRPQLLSYVPLVAVTFLGLGRRWKGSRGDRAVSFLARHSGSVYYCHILVLDVLRRFPLLTAGMRGMCLLLAAELVLSLALALVLDAAIALVKGLRK